MESNQEEKEMEGASALLGGERSRKQTKKGLAFTIETRERES